MLRDPERRRRYDMFGDDGAGRRPATGPGEAFGFGDLFDAFFSGGFGGGGRRVRRGRRMPRRSSSSTSSRPRSATTETLELLLPAPCDRCDGSGCEPGTHPSGATVRRRGRGAPGAPLDPRSARHRGAVRRVRAAPAQRIPNPCTELRRRRPRARDAPHRGRGPGRDRRRPAAPARRTRSRPRRAAGSPATSTSPCACGRTRRSSATASTSSTSAGSR